MRVRSSDARPTRAPTSLRAPTTVYLRDTRPRCCPAVHPRSVYSATKIYMKKSKRPDTQFLRPSAKHAVVFRSC